MRGQRRTTGGGRMAPPGSTTDAIVIIDQGPLRSAAGAKCSAVLARLEEARAAWHRFEREDKRGFVRWRAREFGPLLSELRDLEAQIREREALVHEVEMEMRRGIAFETIFVFDGLNQPNGRDYEHCDNLFSFSFGLL